MPYVDQPTRGTHYAGYLVQFTQAVAVGATSALAHALTGQAKTASMLVLSFSKLKHRCNNKLSVYKLSGLVE